MADRPYSTPQRTTWVNEVRPRELVEHTIGLHFSRNHELWCFCCARLSVMPETDEKETLHRYLDNARAPLLWKLEGLSEYDARRPMTPTGTSLLGLVKHVAAVESWYFGTAFGRAFPGQDELDWDEESQAEMHATAGESPEQIADFYRRVCAHSDATIEALSLDDRGLVPWWP